MSLLHRASIKKARFPGYNFNAPQGGTLFGTLEYTNSLTESFEVSPSNTGGSVTTSTLSGLDYGSYDSSKIPSNWIDFGSKYWWWEGTAGSWTQSGSMSFGCFLVRVNSVVSDAALITNWVNNKERWYSGFSGSTTNLSIYGTGAGTQYTTTANRVYWVNVVQNGSTASLYVDGFIQSSSTVRSGSASGYLTLANYYAIGQYRPGTGNLYVNNLRIYRDSDARFSPS